MYLHTNRIPCLIYAPHAPVPDSILEIVVAALGGFTGDWVYANINNWEDKSRPNDHLIVLVVRVLCRIRQKGNNSIFLRVDMQVI